MLEEFNVSALEKSLALRWERREKNENDMPPNEHRVHRQLVGTLSWIDRAADLRCAMGKTSSSIGRASDTNMRNIQSILRNLRGNPGIATVRPITLTLEAVKRTHVGSAVDVWGQAGLDADRCKWNCVMAARQTWSRKQSTIALRSGEAELVAALSGACEGMSLRQQWNWLLKFGYNAEETNETTQQIVCFDYSAVLGMIKRKASTGKARHTELKKRSSCSNEARDRK